MPSRRDFLSGAAGALGGAALSGGSVLALTDTSEDTQSTEPTAEPTSGTPSPTTTTVHTATSDPTTTHAPTTTSTQSTTATTTTTPTATTTTTTTSKESCHTDKFDCSTIEKARKLGLKTRDSVVFIKVLLDGYGVSEGTGWFVDGKGHIVTNKHVIEGHKELRVYTIDGTRYTPTIKGTSSDPDLALLKIDYDSQPLPIGSETSLTTGQPVLEVGNPAIVGRWVFTLGRYKGLLKYKNKPNDLKTSLPNARGSSGAPTFSLDGKVVGITFGGLPTDPHNRGETPEPAEPEVHVELDRKRISTHEPISDVMAKVKKWK